MTSNSAEKYFHNPYEDYELSNDFQKPNLVNREFCKEYAKETAFQCMLKMKAKPSEKYCGGGVYVGNLGLIFMSYKLLHSGLYTQHEADIKKYILDCFKANEEYYATNDIKATRDVAFILGKGGFYVMAALASRILGDEQNCIRYSDEYSRVSKICEPINFLPRGSDELFVGRAGYLCGILFLKRYLNLKPLSNNELFKICDSIIESGRQYSRRNSSPCPLMYAYHGTEYLGNAHGLSGILQILLSFPEYLRERPEAEADLKVTVDFLLSLQTASGNFPIAMDEINHQVPRQQNKELVHWCHGAGGVIFTMAKAYLHWKESKYLNACIRSGELIWLRGLLRKGPGVCHGVAGNGYAHLLLYRLTSNEKYLYRAVKFADFTQTGKFKKEARTPDSPFSLFEGLAGTVCFILDLIQPQQAEFPLIPTFFNY